MNSYLVFYDIRNAKRLRKVAQLCEIYGIRVQKSLFEIDIEPGRMEIFKRRMKRLIALEDRICYLELCERDRQKQDKYGKGAKLTQSACPYYIL